MYPVDLHMHTVASTHAYSTLHDYIAEAKRSGTVNFTLGIFNIRFNAAQDADAIYQTRPDTHIDDLRIKPPTLKR
jgi:hypothetical protein